LEQFPSSVEHAVKHGLGEAAGLRVLLIGLQTDRGRQAEAVSAFGVSVAWLGRLRVQVGRLWQRDRPGWQGPDLLEEQAAHGS